MLSISKLQQLLYTLGIKTTILMLYTPIYSGPTTLCFEKQEAGVDVVKEKSIFRLMQAGGLILT